MSERPMAEKRLGWISAATFGLGGYQDCMFGLSLSFEGHAEWTESDRDAQAVVACKLLDATLKAAGKMKVHDLVGVPVEVVFGNRKDPVHGVRPTADHPGKRRDVRCEAGCHRVEGGHRARAVPVRLGRARAGQSATGHP